MDAFLVGPLIARDHVLQFNVEEIEKMRKKVQDTSNDLQNLKTQLVSDMDSLKNNWNTPAGKEFLSSVDTDWSVQVDSYVNILKGVDELLCAAKNEYKAIEEDANRLSPDSGGGFR